MDDAPRPDLRVAQFIGTDLAAEVIADLVAALQKLGVLKCREANEREAE